MKSNNLVKLHLKGHIASKSLSNGFPFNPSLSQKKSFQLNNYSNNNIKSCNSQIQRISASDSITSNQNVLKHKKYSSLYSSSLTESAAYSLERPFYSSRPRQATKPNGQHYKKQKQKEKQKNKGLSNRTHRPFYQDEISLLLLFNQGQSSLNGSCSNTKEYQNPNINNSNHIDISEYQNIINDQRNIIHLLNNKVNKATKQTQDLIEENDKLRRKVMKQILIAKKIHLKNTKLELSNNQLFQKKKTAEMAIIKENDYKRAIEQLKHQLKDYKCNLFKQQNAIATSRNTGNNNNNNNDQLKPFNYDNIKQVETHSKVDQYQDNEVKDKLALLQNLYKESNAKIKVYEQYLNSMNINPESLMSRKRNSQNYHDLNIVNNWLETTEEEEETDLFKETEENVIRKNRAMSVYEEDFFELLYIILKSLEGKGITHQLLSDRLTEVYNGLSTIKSNESTREQFADCFAQVVIDFIGVTQAKDIMLMKQFFYALVESSKDDTSVFFNKMIELFDNIHDYSYGNNMNALKESIKNSMKPYKDVIIKVCSGKKASLYRPSFVIEFKEFQKIIRDNKIIVEEDAMEFMIYYMKKTLRNPCGLYDLNLLPLIQLITNSDQIRHSVAITNITNKLKPSIVAHHHKSIS